MLSLHKNMVLAALNVRDVQEISYPAYAMFLTWLLSQATGLRLLAVTARCAFLVPPLRSLRHLLIEVDSIEDAAIASVCQLRCLQTLKLAAKSWYNKICITWHYQRTHNTAQ